MSLSIEQLLTPRIRVEINIPNMPTFSVGDIGIYDADTDRYNMINYPQYVEASEVKRCPECFKRLAWWEFREESEIDCVKYASYKGKVYKVLDKKFDNRRFGHCDNELERRIFMHLLTYWKHKYQPATESEYLNYLNSQK